MMFNKTFTHTSRFMVALCLLSSIQLACSNSTEAEPTIASPTEQQDTPKLQPHVVVAADGTADYKTVQEAIDAAPAQQQEAYYIYIKKGVYKEVLSIPQAKEHIYLIGEDALETVLTFDNYASKKKPDGTEYGTGGSASVFVQGNHFVAENLTFENAAGMNAGQAVAINITAAESAFRNCRFLGHQDTWYAGNGTYQYLKDCYISGSVDFMFGGSTAFFENCDIVSTRDGYLTAASTPKEQAYGYVFDHCRVRAEAGVGENSVYLGRPWRPDAHVVFIHTDMGKHIRSIGWHNWNNPDNEKTANYAEYKSTGIGADVASRVAWSHQLSDEEAANYTYEKVIEGKHPAFMLEGTLIQLNK